MNAYRVIFMPPNHPRYRKRSRARLLLAALLMAIMVSACTRGSDFTWLPTPAPTSTPTISHDEALRRANSLAFAVGLWRYFTLLEVRESLSTFAEMVSSSADELLIDISAEEIAVIDDYLDAEEFVHTIYEQIGAQYGAEVQEVFAFSYHTGMIENYLSGIYPGLNEAQVQARVAGSVEYLRAALAAGEKLGITPEQFARGLQLGIDLQNGADPLATNKAIRGWRNEIIHDKIVLPTRVPTLAIVDPVGISIQQSLPAGDAARGEELILEKACIGCHGKTENMAGPSWFSAGSHDGLNAAQRAQARLQADDYTGQATNVSEYLLESMVLPDADVIAGYPSGVMPPTLGRSLSRQDAADLIAYLLSVE